MYLVQEAGKVGQWRLLTGSLQRRIPCALLQEQIATVFLFGTLHHPLQLIVRVLLNVFPFLFLGTYQGGDQPEIWVLPTWSIALVDTLWRTLECLF